MSMLDEAFNAPVVSQVLDICINAQSQGSDVEVYDEFRCLVRAIRYPGTLSGVCSSRSVPALLEFLMESLEQGEVAPPSAFVERLREASGAETGDGNEYFSTIVELVKLAESETSPFYDEIPMSNSEASIMFASMSGFSAMCGLPLNGRETVRSAVEAAIAKQHPKCGVYLGGLAGDARAALTMFPVESELRETLGPVFPWVSSAALEEVISLALDHMRTEHSSVR